MTIAVSTDLMRRSDQAEIAAGTPSVELMRRAGVVLSECYPWENGVVIVCGVGNNGGDGYALALELHQRGVFCRLVLQKESFSADGKYYFDQCVAKKIPFEVFSANSDFSDASAVVDCLFGTGFHGSAIGAEAELIHRINRCGKPVISADINSGLNGNSGQGDPCVISTLTLAIGSYKYGHFLGKAKDVMCEKACADIGIPILNEPICCVAESADFRDLFAYRLQNSHKGNYGYVGILGGCAEYSGAAKLANLSYAALRSGCGVATLAVPQSIAMGVMPYLLESTMYPVADDGKGHMVFDAPSLEGLMRGRKAIAVGMGWGESVENQRILTYLLQRYEGTLVIDADGLNALAKLERSLLRNCRGKVVLTPHLKEFERISGIPMAEILKTPVEISRAFAKENGVCLLLKGACTVVTDGETCYLVDRGCAGMATAGSGDVLSGVLAGILGYAEPTPKTVACGAYLAGLAGEMAQKANTAVGMIASDTVGFLPQAIAQML